MKMQRAMNTMVLTVVLLAGAGCVASQPQGKPLYDRLGGKGGITAVVETFVGNVGGDARINGYFASTDLAKLKDDMKSPEVQALIDKGVISGGMIPKAETALEALKQGVRAVVILDGRVPNACLLELFTDHGAGSIIRSTAPRVKPRTPRPSHRTRG